MLKLSTLLASLLLVSQGSFAATVASSTSEMDYGIVAGAFAPKPQEIKAGGMTYYVIAPDLVEPVCNSTQIVVWVVDEQTEGDAGGVAYNLGYQVQSVKSVVAAGDEVKITYTVNSVDDCSKSITKEVYIKYKGDAAPLQVRE